MPSIKTKYGTVINTSGLSPDQIAKVREVAEGNGAYGAKGRALADSYRKRNTAKTTPTPETTNPTTTPTATPNAGITPVGGAINPAEMFASAQANWNDDRAKQLRDEAQNAAYSFTTRDYATQKQQELADLEQQMAQRGIPFDPNNPDSLYGKNKSAIDKKYADMEYQAKNLAIQQGNQLYQTETQTNQGAFDSFINAALGMSQADLAKYGIDQNMIAEAKRLKAQKEAARLAAAGRGGGGGGQDSGDLISPAGFGS